MRPAGPPVWKNLTPSPLPASWPASRGEPAFVFDSERRAFVLFGGSANSGSGGFLRDLWAFDGASGTWTNRTPSPIPKSWPSDRYGPAMAYDARRGKAVLFGGGSMGSGSFPRDTWEWNGDTWANRTPSSLPASWPPGRYATSMVFDAGGGRIVLFGGKGPSVFLSDLWEWDGEAGTWTNRSQAPSPGVWPAGRAGSSLAYDAGRGRVVAFGGSTGDAVASTYLAETWEWDGKAGKWQDRTPGSLPPSWPSARLLAGAAYYGPEKVVVIFGGKAQSGKRQDLWAWDGERGSWTDRTPSPLPSPWPSTRLGARLAYDEHRHQIVLYGGEAIGEPALWEWGP